MKKYEKIDEVFCQNSGLTIIELYGYKIGLHWGDKLEFRNDGSVKIIFLNMVNNYL